MLYKIEREIRPDTIPTTVYVVYERPFVCTKWKRDLPLVSLAAAEARVKHLKTFAVEIDWSATYRLKEGE